MSWTAVTFSTGDFPTAAKFLALVDRDDALKTYLEDTHDHDGTEGSLLYDPTTTYPGAVAYWTDTEQISSSSSGTLWLTSDGTSGGTNIFDVSLQPNVLVLAEYVPGTWTCDGIGHKAVTYPSGNGTDFDYYSLLDYSSSKWRLRVYNEAVSNAGLFLCIAIGKGV